ncbi:MAG: Asp-tRNA(Asn)/Glu-tRNA(Gln) amidotransferase subunit GatC, partial [Patescibacteria group bacterium]
SRLKLSDDEMEMYQSQFSSILDFINHLNKLNISSSDILGIEGKVKNQLREDEFIPCPEDERIASINQAFDSEEDQIKVKRVL